MLTSRTGIVNKNVIFDKLASLYCLWLCGGHLSSGLLFVLHCYSCYSDNWLMVVSALMQRVLELKCTHTRTPQLGNCWATISKSLNWLYFFLF